MITCIIKIILDFIMITALIYLIVKDIINNEK